MLIFLFMSDGAFAFHSEVSHGLFIAGADWLRLHSLARAHDSRLDFRHLRLLLALVSFVLHGHVLGASLLLEGRLRLRCCLLRLKVVHELGLAGLGPLCRFSRVSTLLDD